jgi:predicted phosphodiesterase
MPAQALDPAVQETIARRLAAGESAAAVARDLGIDRGTVRRYSGRGGLSSRTPVPYPMPKIAPSLPEPAPEAGGPSLPDPVSAEFTPYEACDPGAWGVLSDAHIPFHDLPTIRGWVADCKRMGVVGLILNGDTLDCHLISSHLKDPSAPRMKSEIEKGRQFLEYLRSEFPRARIVFKEGNHDDRLRRFLADRAPELYDLDELHLPALLRAAQLGVEWVADKRVVKVGKLPVLHGHEYQGGGGVMPARWLFLRTGDSALCGHFHQPSSYTFRTVNGREVGVWSTGCACYLSPAYRPLNQWGHGWAVVEVAADRGYHVHNRRLLKNGQVT